MERKKISISLNIKSMELCSWPHLVSLVQPDVYRINVGRATMTDMVDFCQSKGITLENILKPLWEIRTDESSLEINGSDEKNEGLLQ